MFESGYYPPGAEHDPRAPYNQVDPDPKDFDVDVCYVLTKTATISSDNYIGGYRDDEGFYEAAEYQGDVKEDYQDQFLTPLQIMKEYKTLCERQLFGCQMDWTIASSRDGKKKIGHLKRVIASIEGWEEEFEPQ